MERRFAVLGAGICFIFHVSLYPVRLEFLRRFAGGHLTGDDEHGEEVVKEKGGGSRRIARWIE